MDELMQEYLVLHETSARDITRSINEQIEDGWQLVGTVQATVDETHLHFVATMQRDN